MLKYLKDKEDELLKAGFTISPEYYENIAVLEFKEGYLLTTITAVEKHAKQIEQINRAGTDSAAKKAVHDSAVDKVHGSDQKRKKADGGNNKKHSK